MSELTQPWITDLRECDIRGDRERIYNPEVLEDACDTVLEIAACLDGLAGITQERKQYAKVMKEPLTYMGDFPGVITGELPINGTTTQLIVEYRLSVQRCVDVEKYRFSLGYGAVTSLMPLRNEYTLTVYPEQDARLKIAPGMEGYTHALVKGDKKLVKTPWLVKASPYDARQLQAELLRLSA
jgi:hypothetical protein